MGELDFSQDYFDSDTMLLSSFGISDLRHQYWPLLYGIVQEENKTFCTKMIEYGQNMMSNANLKMNSLLSDRGTAIISCANEKLLPHKPCFTHTMREGFTRGGGYRGGVGSALRLLKDKVMYNLLSIIYVL